MSTPEARTRIEHLLSLPVEQREREAALTDVAEPALLELIDEVRDLVMSDLDRALAMGEVLRMLSDRLAIASARARSRSAWAHALNYANRFDEAIDALDEAARIARENNDPLEDARASLAKAQSLARLGRFDEAIEACVYAEQIFEDANDPGLALRAVTNHAIILRMLGHWVESVDRFDRALELARVDPTLSAQIQSNRAETLLELGRFADAEKAFRQSCELLEIAGMERVAAIVRGNLADLLGRQGRLSESIKQFELARRFFEQDRAAGDLARIEAELADVYAATGLTEDAVELYARSCEALESSGLAVEQARALMGLGALLIAGEPDRAREVLGRARSAWDTLGDERAVARIDLLCAQLAVREGDLETGASLADLGAETEGESHVNRIARRTIGAEIQVGLGDTGAALDLLGQALSIADGLGLPPVQADLHHRLGRTLSADGQREDALASYRRAIGEIERIRGALRGDRCRAAFLGDHSAIYQDCADALLDSDALGAVVEAFDVTEQARSRALLEMVQGGVELGEQVGQSVTAQERGLLERLARERARVNYCYSRLDPSGGEGSQIRMSEWLETLREAESAIGEIETRLVSSRAARGVLGTPTPGLEIIGGIAEDAASLVFARYHDSMGCYCLRKGTVEFVDLGLPIDRLEELAGGLGFQLRRVVVRGSDQSGRAARRQAAAVRAARELCDAVFRPLEGLLDGIERLMIVPSADLHAVPFPALHDGERYLVERYSITRMPSVSLAQAIAPAPEGKSDSALVIGVPDRFAPEIRAEADAVAGVLQGATLLIGEAADADRVLREMGRAGVIHIASHGIFPAGNPMAAALRMGDRWITAREIFSARLDGAVVVLSGCETGRTETERGEETYGFIRAFLAAGAGGVVSSLWAAHDRTARTLMTNMYTLAPDNGSPTAKVFAGLRSAQLKAIEESLHPGLWAGFSAVGAG